MIDHALAIRRYVRLVLLLLLLLLLLLGSLENLRFKRRLG